MIFQITEQSNRLYSYGNKNGFIRAVLPYFFYVLFVVTAIEIYLAVLIRSLSYFDLTEVKSKVAKIIKFLNLKLFHKQQNALFVRFFLMLTINILHAFWLINSGKFLLSLEKIQKFSPVRNGQFIATLPSDDSLVILESGNNNTTMQNIFGHELGNNANNNTIYFFLIILEIILLFAIPLFLNKKQFDFFEQNNTKKLYFLIGICFILSIIIYWIKSRMANILKQMNQIMILKFLESVDFQSKIEKGSSSL